MGHEQGLFDEKSRRFALDFVVCKSKLKRFFSVILLEKVMTSLGTHLVKNSQSQSRIIKSLFKKQRVN